MTIEILPPLRVTHTETGILVAGDIDASTVSGLALALLPLPPGSGDIELNMANVDFIDSSGLQVLIQAHQSATDQDRRVVIADPSPNVSRLLQLSGLNDVLHIVRAVD
jgi:anti-sigma B factor antagonist